MSVLLPVLVLWTAETQLADERMPASHQQSTMNSAGSFLLVSALLHVTGSILSGFSTVGMFLLFPAALYSAFWLGLRRGRIWVAYVALVCMLGGMAGTGLELLKVSSVPDAGAAAIATVSAGFARSGIQHAAARHGGGAARASHAAQVQSRIKKLDKIERIILPPEQRKINFAFPVAPRSGDDVLHLQNLKKEWIGHDGRTIPVFSGLSGTVRRLEKIAVVGVNGAGKSTLLKTITGETDPTDGEVLMGASVTTGYFSQHAMDSLTPQHSVFDAIQEVLPTENIGTIRNLLASFLFQGDDVDKKIENLSGGEKSRVVLAKLLGRPLNFLVLDEPTNHLDILSRDVLLEALKKFQGTVILVSHDRHFLRSLVNRVFEIDRGELRIYEGNYDYYLRETSASK